MLVRSTERGGPSSSALALAPMQQLVDAKGPEDDWTGLTDRAERRKRQNRLNVRAHRRRKAAASRQQGPAEPDNAHGTCCQEVSSVTSGSQLANTTHGHFAHPPEQTRPFSFPLSLDHLIPLIEYNLWRASITNIYILSVFSLLADHECSSSPALPPLFPRTDGSSVPLSLAPTALQQSTPHEIWIDILPSPQMRDNAIVATRAGRLSNEALCRDLFRGLCGQGEEATGGDEVRLLAWTNPWEAAGWEVTEWFLKRYGFLVKGCDDMRRATNRWREERGDEPIVWEVE